MGVSEGLRGEGGKKKKTPARQAAAPASLYPFLPLSESSLPWQFLLLAVGCAADRLWWASPCCCSTGVGGGQRRQP